MSQQGADENQGDIKSDVLKDGHDQLTQTQCQVFITFNADCTFTAEMASTYFSQYGEVKHVQIPNKENRTFGFVTFATPDTVTKILSRRNPVHYISEDRVKVKECKENANPRRAQEERPFFLPPAVMECPRMDVTTITPADFIAYAIHDRQEALNLERAHILHSYLEDVEEPRWQDGDACLDTDSKKEARSHPSSASSPCFSADELEYSASSSPSTASPLVLSQTTSLSDYQSYKETPMDKSTSENLQHIHERNERAKNNEEIFRRCYRKEVLRDHLRTRPPTAHVQSTLTCPPNPSKSLDNTQCCCKCKSATQHVVGTSCDHGFCLKCLMQVLWIPEASCPLCFLSL